MEFRSWRYSEHQFGLKFCTCSLDAQCSPFLRLYSVFLANAMVGTVFLLSIKRNAQSMGASRRERRLFDWMEI